ncbi:growth arrest and DNA damage-inducible proteins-interacting protein 1 [Nylanderia fulva]|uniref:growth arrest and DNA damage-inducible proteins-interacting protein 1 n=1 Tax=Nylanderia fulva TaxID=613905 RepID=UPI0010FB71B1|nr:growth arrest and DNA damage-inducible proteins-interacting protein 1 [Nylanderia fulva]
MAILGEFRLGFSGVSLRLLITHKFYPARMSLRCIYDIVVRRNVRVQKGILGRFFATDVTDLKNKDIDITAVADEKPEYSVMDSPGFQEELARKRNKSRLDPAHRNILMDLRPYDKPMAWHHYRVKYKKHMLGRYGLKGNDEPAGFAWPTEKELADVKEYERVTCEFSLQKRWRKMEEAKQKRIEKIKARENQLLERIMKMDEWSNELRTKLAKKEAELEAARLRKERLVEEVRRHFGFKISFHDERFKEMIAQKEKEEKRKRKEAKKQARMEKLSSLHEKNSAKNNNEEQVTDSTKPVE